MNGEKPSKPRDGAEDATFKGWSSCADAMKDYDHLLVKGWKEEIDTLLLLAGLFSAVLTSFTVQSYQLLQQDPQDAMLTYMKAIIDRMDNPGTAAPVPLNNSVTPAARRINLVWFSGLLLSLLAGLVGILGKQWLREYLTQRLSAPRDAVRLRQFRYGGLLRWRVSDIIAMLPLLLQASLVLFIIGLLDLLWSIIRDRLIAIFASAIVGMFFILIFTSVLMPLFFPACPYKSPLALQLRSLVLLVRETFTHGFRSIKVSDYTQSLHHGWYDADASHVLQQPEHSLASLEHSALIWAYRAVVSDSFQDTLAPCVYELPSKMRVQFVQALLCQHAGLPVTDMMRRIRDGPQGANAALHRGLLRAGHNANARMLTLLLDVLPDAIPHSHKATTEFTRSDLLNIIHPLLHAFVWTGKQQYSTRSTLTRRVYDSLLDLLGYQAQPSDVVTGIFGVLLSFDNLFWKMVTMEDVTRMLDGAIRNATESHYPGMTPSRYLSPTLVVAAPAVLHYAFALSDEQLAHPTFRAKLVQVLQQHMAVYIENQNDTNVGQMAPRRTIRVSWSWELCRIAQRDASLINPDLIGALIVNDRKGLLHGAEKAPLESILAALDKAGLDRAFLATLYQTRPRPPDREATLVPEAPRMKGNLLAPLHKIHTRTRSGSSSRGIAPALVHGVMRTMSSSSGILTTPPDERRPYGGETAHISHFPAMTWSPLRSDVYARERQPNMLSYEVLSTEPNSDRPSSHCDSSEGYFIEPQRDMPQPFSHQ